MKKILLLMTMVLTCVGAWAQTPVVSVSNIGTAPFQLSDEDAAKIFELENLTVVLDVTTAASLSGRGAFFCVADPAQDVPDSFSGTNTSYMACGHVNEVPAYIAAAKGGQHFSTGTIPASSTIRIAYVFDKTNNKFRIYIGDTNTGWTMDRNFGTYEIATPKMVKEDFANANIYIGGGMVNNATHETGDAIIHRVRVYDGTLTIDEIKALSGMYYSLKNGDHYITSNVINSRVSCSETKDANSIYYFDGNHLLAYKTGLYFGLNANDWTFETIGSNDISAIEIIKAVNNADDKYNISSGGRWLHKSTNGDGSTFVNRCQNNTCGDTHNWTLEQVEALPVTITTAKYATFYAPVAVEVPEGVTAHTVTINGERATLSEALGVIPANTGVVLYSETAGTYDFAITKDVDAISGNALRGSAATTYFAETGTYYALGLVNDEVGFYRDAFNNNRFQNNSHKAYLYVPNASQVKAFLFETGETTAIETVETEKANAPIYDLSGRRVLSTVKGGIYIQNGKKFIVK